MSEFDYNFMTRLFEERDKYPKNTFIDPWDYELFLYGDYSAENSLKYSSKYSHFDF